jgi:hypothetical protein
MRYPDQREYDDQQELENYVWRNYKHALSQREQALHSAALKELKLRVAPAYRIFFPNYRLEADVAAVVERGLAQFERECCERLLRDYVDQIYINRCERCNRIVVSPISCFCLWCRHKWFERRSELIARSKSSIYPAPES